MTEARTYPAGVTSWIDVEVDDVEAAKAFYGGLFGWTFNQATPPGIPFTYVIAQLDGQDVAGIEWSGRRPPGRRTGRGTPTSRSTTSTPSAAAVKAAGGSVVEPVEQAAGEGGWYAAIADPAGVEVRLWQAKNRLGAQLTNAPGSWNFSDLSAADPDASKPFYERVFGWEFGDLGFATMIRRPGYGDHLAATTDPDIFERQSGVNTPPGFADAIGWLGASTPEVPPGWHVTFTVADRDQTVGRVEQLGGRVLREEDTDWTKTAVILDPQGAEFTASQFTPPE